MTRARGDEDFDGAVVGLGALGAVTRVTLDVEPAYEVRQRVFEGLPWDALFEHLDEIIASGYSVSVFNRLSDDVAEQVWVKMPRARRRAPRELFSARAATEQRHPIPGLDPVNCTPQLGVPGLWSDRLPTFRMGFTPEQRRGDPVRVPHPARARRRGDRRGARARRRDPAGAQVVRAPHDGRRPPVAQPAVRRDTVGIHFTWGPDQPAVERVLAEVEPALAPFGARPHWGKLFLAAAPRAAVRAAARLRRAGGAHRPARRVPQPLAGEPGPQRRRERCPWNEMTCWMPLGRFV